MRSQVIVSNVAKHHAFEAAVALQKGDMLKSFYTGFYAKDDMGLLQKLVVKLMSKNLKKKISNRRHEELDEKKVITYFLPEILERTPLKKKLEKVIYII